jgi:hypothetical protein
MLKELNAKAQRRSAAKPKPKVFAEGNEGNEERAKFSQKCAILGNGTAKSH